MAPPKIKTKHNMKPIPERGLDWEAWIDGQEEDGVGYGRTKEEAIKDLHDLYGGDWE